MGTTFEIFEDCYHQLDLLQRKAQNCSDFTWRIIENANHVYYGKEEQTAELILSWLERFQAE